MSESELVGKLLNDGNGMLLASAAVKSGISRRELSQMVGSGLLERAERGVYIRAGELDDEMYSMQQHARKIVYSHETALFLHSLTDRTPSFFSITVPSAYKPSLALKKRCKVYYIRPELIDLGKILMPTDMGHEVFSYDLERTLCDVVRSRNKMDRQLVMEAIKNYVAGNHDLNRLAEYAGHFGIQRILSSYLEVLL